MGYKSEAVRRLIQIGLETEEFQATGDKGMTCKCGFKFAGPGEFRNCAAFITKDGKSGVTCPDCGTSYVSEEEVKVDK